MHSESQLGAVFSNLDMKIDICAHGCVLHSTAMYYTALHSVTLPYAFHYNAMNRTTINLLHFTTPHFKEGAGFVPVRVHVFAWCVRVRIYR